MYFDEHCLQVSCLYARSSHVSHVQTSLNFPRMLPVVVARSSSDGGIICHCISGFMDYVFLQCVLWRSGATAAAVSAVSSTTLLSGIGRVLS